jgi:hypothetical protein
MNIIKEKWLFLNGTLLHTPKQIKQLYAFGLQTIAAEHVVSLRSNARLSGLRWPTAKSKIWRLTKNRKIVPLFEKLSHELNRVTKYDIIAVDFSDFGNGFQVLMFAKQTKRGRAMPLYFEILRYPIPKDSQNLFVNTAIKRFGKIMGCKPMLVFDRGFMCPSIMRFLLENQWKFIVRLRAAKFAMDPEHGKTFPVCRAEINDRPVVMYENIVRLVTSEKTNEMKEPWYLATNDITLSREAIIDRYYHRFEIEEFFRDAKRLLGLEQVSWKTENSLAVTLWFVMLGIWCLAHIAEAMDDLAQRSREKMQLSEIRYIFETLRAEIFCATEAKYLHSYDV